MIGVIVLWGVLPVLLIGLLFLTAHPLPQNQRVGIAALWCIVVGLSAPYTLGRFPGGWERTAIFWGIAIVGTLSVLWGVVLVYPPKARPPTTPGKPSSNFVSAETRTYRMARKGLWR